MTSFPRQQARTRRFSLGVPRGFTPGVGAGGPFVLFLRSDTGEDPVTHLWRWDAHDGRCRKLVDARQLTNAEDDLPPAERSRRERAREMAGGITSYSTDDAASMAVFALNGRLFTTEVASGVTVEHPTVGPVFDPRPSPDGTSVAYHALDALQMVELTGGPRTPGSGRTLVSEPGVAWGRAEFVAAEEMGRGRGFWWSGDGSTLAVARVDERDVEVWTIADAANPSAPPARHRYPAAGTSNADVSLWTIDLASGRRAEVLWDRVAHEYLAQVTWGDGPLTLVVQPRDQRSVQILTADPGGGATRLERSWHDEAWVELVPGSPRWLGDRLVTVEDRAELGPDGTRVVCVDGKPITAAGLQVRELVGVLPAQRPADGSGGAEGPGGAGAVVFLASGDDPTQVHPYEVAFPPAEGGAPTPARPHPSAAGLARGVHRLVLGDGAWRSGATPMVSIHRTMERPQPTVTIHDRSDDDAGEGRALDVVATTPVLTARPRFLVLGPRRLRAALFLPSDDAGSSPLPVLLDPYGGPHAQRVVHAQGAHLTSQWLADQGFAVLVVDGRGSPGRGPRFERAVHRDLATPVLEDQVGALEAAAALEPRLDLSRVGIRGWSFGGFLAALAVLRRPDVFRAGIAGAPVTDWHLYDTHYTERYLGQPDRDAAAYAVSSLVDGDGRLLGVRPWPPARPPALLLIHGLADDNVVAAHTLRLSGALLADGRPHRFLPLSGVTHMTPQEVVAEQLLVQQVQFLREALTT